LLIFPLDGILVFSLCGLLKLKEYIKGLLNYLKLQSDSDSWKDAKRLKQIMITEDEWLLIHNLKEILFYFAEAIDYLGESKYYTYNVVVLILLFHQLWWRFIHQLTLN